MPRTRRKTTPADIQEARAAMSPLADQIWQRKDWLAVLRSIGPQPTPLMLARVLGVPLVILSCWEATRPEWREAVSGGVGSL